MMFKSSNAHHPKSKLNLSERCHKDHECLENTVYKSPVFFKYNSSDIICFLLDSCRGLKLPHFASSEKKNCTLFTGFLLLLLLIKKKICEDKNLYFAAYKIITALQCGFLILA